MIIRGLLLVMMVVSLSGCILFCVACDSAVAIKVSVADERGTPYRDCWVELLDSMAPAGLNKTTILDSKFVTGFVLAGPAWVHPPSRLRVGCKESDETFTIEPKELAGTYPTPIDLGTVRLKRRAK